MQPQTEPDKPDPADSLTSLEQADAGHSILEESRMWNVVSYLITGPAMFGGLGALLDRWIGTAFLLPVGIVGGMVISLYVVWLRYGTE